MPGLPPAVTTYLFVNIILWCIMLCTLLSASRLASTSDRVQSAIKFSKRLYRSSNSFAVIAWRTAPNSSLSIFANSFKGFQIATFRFVGVFSRINQRHIICFCRPTFTRNGRRVSYFVMSIPGKFKPEIADCCFCSHCFYLLALPGKRPVVVISCHKNTVNILITKTFIFYFVFAAKKYSRYGVMSYREQSKQFHLCIGQYSNDRINFAFPTF